MERSRATVYFVSVALLAAGLGLMLYKVATLGFPLLPGESRIVWTLESKITFKTTGQPVEARLSLPPALAGWEILDEYFASSGLAFGTEEHDEHRIARWTRKELNTAPVLYYKVQIVRTADQPLKALPVVPPHEPMLDSDMATAMARFREKVDLQSANSAHFVTLLLQELAADEPDQEAAYLLSEHIDNRIDLMLDVLALQGIPSHRLRGVFLEDGRRRQTVSELIEAHTHKGWQVFDPATAQAGLPDNFFIWVRGDGPLLDVMGGLDSRLQFAMVRNSLPLKTVLAMEQQSDLFPLLDFSIYRLPVEHQGVFKSILLIPVGALVVVLLRVLVGLSSAGTFMPILIALAFIQTTLFLGLVMFLVVVSAGLWIRFYLSHLNLLLVPRISAVIIVVVLLMAAMSVISYRLGMEQALIVTLFPTIILSWTIERMSILWEEQGPREVLIQGSGSLIVAVVAYLTMTNPYVAHISFNFPEVLLALLAIILLIGQYRGYRLTELYRFRYLKDI